MTKRVPYMAVEDIEQDAAALLTEYAREKGVVIAPPIPIEDILEKHLKLSIEFVDTHSMFGIPRLGADPDVLGAMFFEDSRIVIDESLDPEEHPEFEGRYRFTLAHEGGGHWRLHRRYFKSNSEQAGALAGPVPPSVICRSSQAKESVEWQADFYASCLLMPRKLVFAAWDEMYPDRNQRVIKPNVPVRHPFVEVERIELLLAGGPCWTESVDAALNRFARPLAEKFLVSTTAMRIRLENLGLLLRDLPHEHLRAGA